MSTRAVWRGWLTVAELSCGVALHAAASTAERISLHMVNRKTGNRTRRQYVDEDTGRVVEPDDLAKGREQPDGSFLIFDEEEIAAATPEAQKTLDVAAFIPCDGVDPVFFDRPYFVYPDSGDAAREAYALILRQMQKSKTAALASAVLFRRERRLLIRPHGQGLIAHTLQYDHEIRPEAEVFKKIPEVKIEKELLDLAKHIIATRKGDFDPETFHDRYEEAFVALIRAKVDGKPLPKAKKPPKVKQMDLREALRQSMKKAS